MKKLVVCMLIMVMSLSLFACAGSNTGLAEVNVEGPSKVAEDFLSAVKSEDVEALQEVYAGNAEDVINADDKVLEIANEKLPEGVWDDAFAELKEKVLDFNYAVVNENIEGDKATVEVEIKSYDMGKALNNWFTAYLTASFEYMFDDVSNAELNKKGVELLNKELDKLVEKTYSDNISIDLTKVNNEWLVDEMENDEDMYNALTGDMVEIFKQLSEKLL